MKNFTLGLWVLFTSFMTAQAQSENKPVPVTQTPPTVIFKQLINTDELKNQEVTLVVVTLAPREVSAAHRHPIPTIGYVLDGEVEMNFSGKTHHFKQGDTFYEVPNALHAGTKNVSTTKEARLLVYFIGKKGKPFIIPAH